MARSSGSTSSAPMRSTTIGMAKNDIDDPAGIEDMERALEIALEIDSPIASSIVNNLAVYAILDGDLPRADELYAEALRARASGSATPSSVRFIRGEPHLGRLHARPLGRRARAADAVHRRVRGGIAAHARVTARGVRAHRSARARGDLDGALADHRACGRAGARDERSDQLCGCARGHRGRPGGARAARTRRTSSRAECSPTRSRARRCMVRWSRLAPFADELGHRRRAPRGRRRERRARACRAGESVLEQSLAGELVRRSRLLAAMGTRRSRRTCAQARRALIAAGGDADGEVGARAGARVLPLGRRDGLRRAEPRARSPALRASRRRRARSGRSCPAM